MAEIQLDGTLALPADGAPSSRLAGHARLPIYALYIVWLLFMDLFISLAVLLASVFSIGSDSTAAIVMGVFAVLWPAIAHNDPKLPFSTALDGSTLTTVGLLGRRSIDLAEVARVDRIGYIHGRYGSSEKLLRLRPAHGRPVYLGLNALPKAQRRALAAAVASQLDRAGVQVSSNAAYELRGLAD